MLEKIKRLLAKTENSKSIEAALAEIDIPSLQRDLADAGTRRTSLLLSGTDPQLLAAEKAIQSARLALDRAEAAQAELQTRLVAAPKAESKAAFDCQYAEAVAARDAAIARLEKDYAAAARLVSGVLADVEAADRLVAAVNAELRNGWFNEQHPGHGGVDLRSVSGTLRRPFPRQRGHQDDHHVADVEHGSNRCRRYVGTRSQREMSVTNTVNLPHFGRSAEFRSASFDDSDNTIEVIWTTGASVRRHDWRSGRYYQEVLEVSPSAVRLDRLNAGAPFLDTHNDAKLAHVIGSVVPGSAKIEDGKGYARVKLSRAADDAAIVEKIKDGIIRNISVGYAIHRVVKTDNGGDGVDDDGASWIGSRWKSAQSRFLPMPEAKSAKTIAR